MILVDKKRFTNNKRECMRRVHTDVRTIRYRHVFVITYDSKNAYNAQRTSRFFLFFQNDFPLVVVTIPYGSKIKFKTYYISARSDINHSRNSVYVYNVVQVIHKYISRTIYKRVNIYRHNSFETFELRSV